MFIAQLIGIVVANLVPLAGAIFFGWSVFEVILVYWFENVAIGVTHFLKMRLCARTNGETSGRAAASFFAMHYGIFTLVHGVFVNALFGLVAGGYASYQGGILLPVLVTMGWQYASFRIEAAQTQSFKGYRSTDMFFQPYPRMFALHITILAGGWFIAEAGSPFWALALLVALKTLFDIGVFTVSSTAKSGESALTVEETPTGYSVSLRKHSDRAPH